MNELALNWYSKPITKKVKDIDPKYIPKPPEGTQWDDSEATQAWLIEAAINAENNEKEAIKRKKQEAEERRKLEQREQEEKKQQEERRKQRQQYLKNLPQRQFEKIVSAENSTCSCCKGRMSYYEVCRNWECRIQPMNSISPGLDYLRQEVSRLNQQIEHLKQQLVTKKSNK